MIELVIATIYDIYIYIQIPYPYRSNQRTWEWLLEAKYLSVSFRFANWTPLHHAVTFGEPGSLGMGRSITVNHSDWITIQHRGIHLFYRAKYIYTYIYIYIYIFIHVQMVHGVLKLLPSTREGHFKFWSKKLFQIAEGSWETTPSRWCVPWWCLVERCLRLWLWFVVFHASHGTYLTGNYAFGGGYFGGSSRLVRILGGSPRLVSS